MCLHFHATDRQLRCCNALCAFRINRFIKTIMQTMLVYKFLIICLSVPLHILCSYVLMSNFLFLVRAGGPRPYSCLVFFLLSLCHVLLLRKSTKTPLTHTPHRCAELPYRGAIVCCYKLLPYPNSLPASPYSGSSSVYRGGGPLAVEEFSKEGEFISSSYRGGGCQAGGVLTNTIHLQKSITHMRAVKVQMAFGSFP